jgi:site-specific DNA recombinase
MKNKKIEPGQLELILGQALKKKYTTTSHREKRCAVIYTRVSSQEQAENNGSLEVQLKYCRQYAENQGIVIKAYFGGTYESAKTDGRKEFQRMLQYIKKDKDISYLIVWNFDRFSRTGSGAQLLSGQLREMGVTLKSVSQDIDTNTPGGRLQENLMHVLNHYDNDAKSHRTKTNMREVMLKGYWPYSTPLGYQNLKPKHRAIDHKYIITEEGKWIKKAFQWKIEGKMTNKEICQELNKRGLRLTEKNFNYIISNPFYCGYVTGGLLKGELVKGHHPALVDLKTFSKANDLIKTYGNAGIPKKQKHEELPLKVFAKEELTEAPLTGFRQKGIWYYKARGKEVKFCMNASELNKAFEKELHRFEYDKKYREKLQSAIEKKLKAKLSDLLEENTRIKKRITELQNQIEALEEKFVLDKINEELYLKFSRKYKQEMVDLELQLSNSLFDSSNLKKAVEKGLAIAANIRGDWASKDFNAKQKLQKLIFPEGIRCSKENGIVQTGRVNTLFKLIQPWERVSKENKKSNSDTNCSKSSKVTPSGFKPETF